MDILFLHLDGQPRRFPGPPALAQAGRFARKDHRVQRTFDTWNFSLILSGRGDYRHEGRLLPVAGPCILTQWPGARMDYGPDRRGWQEIYLIYAADAGARLREQGLWPGRPWWPVVNPRRFLRAAEDLATLLRAPDPSVDLLDRAGELALVEGLLGAAPEHPGGMAAQAVRAIRDEVEARWRHDHDFAALAREHGLSTTHFRRWWLRLVGVPPARYLLELRLRHAARALVVSDTPVANVAMDSGFPDPLHFSRRFREVFGQPPTRYRDQYRH